MLTTAAPAGSRLKGYEEIIVQDIAFKLEVTLYRRERWTTPDGRTVTADPPAGVVGGCGPNLHRLVLMLHFQGQMTCERIVTLLTAAGLSISKRQVVRLLTVRLDLFRAEEEATFGAGPRIKSGSSPGVAPRPMSALTTPERATPARAATRRSLAPTGSRRSAQDRANRASRCLTQSSGRNGALCGQRGGGRLHARGQPGARRHRCAEPSRSPRIRLRGRLAGAFARARPDRIARHPRSRARRQRKRGSWGAITAEDRLAGAVILSDDAGQFRVGDHALCWVHAERLVYKLIPANDRQRSAGDPPDLIRALRGG